MRILQTDEDWLGPEKQTSLQFDNPKHQISMHDIIDDIVTGVFFVRSFNAFLLYCLVLVHLSCVFLGSGAAKKHAGLHKY